MDDKSRSRSGPSVGHAIEERLIDKMGGEDTIRKTYYYGEEGVTRVHTRGPGSRPEIYTEKPPEESPHRRHRWSFSYAALKKVDGVYEQDTYYVSGFGDVAMESLTEGPKTRRFGLRLVDGGNYGIAVRPSSYGVNSTFDGQQVRGANYWYSKDGSGKELDVVTWTRRLPYLDSGGWFDRVYNWIEYGDGLQKLADTSGSELQAACIAYSADGTQYLRAVFLSPAGTGTMEVFDYEMGGSLFATTSITVSEQVDAETLKWSPNGLKLIARAYKSGYRNSLMIYDVPAPGGTISITEHAYPPVETLRVYQCGFSNTNGVCYTLLGTTVSTVTTYPDADTTLETTTNTLRAFLVHDDVVRLSWTYSIEFTKATVVDFGVSPATKTITWSAIPATATPTFRYTEPIAGIAYIVHTHVSEQAAYEEYYERPLSTWNLISTTYVAPTTTQDMEVYRIADIIATRTAGTADFEGGAYDWDDEKSEGVFIVYGPDGAPPWTLEGYFYTNGSWFSIVRNPDEPLPEYQVGYGWVTPCHY